MIKKLVGALLLLGVEAFGQQTTYTFTAGAPTGVTSVNVQRTGNQGNSTYYVWVVANLPIGQASTTYGQIISAPDSLTVRNYITAFWPLVNGATSYDVLVTTSPFLPSPCTCSATTGVTTNTYAIKSNTLSSYTYAPAPVATASVTLNNSSFTQPVLYLNAPVNSIKYANLPSAASSNGLTYLVVDAASYGCSSGGGTVTPGICWSNGSSWIPLGGSGGGSGFPVTINGATLNAGGSVNANWNAGSLTNGHIATWDGTGGELQDGGAVPAGISGLTTNVIPKASSSTTLTNSGFTDNGTTISTNENVTVGTDNSVAGTLQMANGSANAHTIWGSGATTTNTILGFATVPANGHIVTCTVSSTTCTLTDGGAAASGTVTNFSSGNIATLFTASVATATTTPALTWTLTSAAAGTIPYATSSSAASWSATPTLGASGTLGSLTMGNASSGTVTLEPVTGALGTVTASLPANTGTIAELNLAQTWTAQQIINTTAAGGGALGLLVSPAASANYGTLSVGGGPFNGSSTGHFAGNSSGTSIAVNEASGYGGNLMDLQVAGTSKFSVASNGVATATILVALGGSSELTNIVDIGDGSGITTGSNGTLVLQNAAISTANKNAAKISPTFSSTSGAAYALGIVPVYNQASGTAANTDLVINRTETAVGSGAQWFQDWQVGGSTKGHLDHAGILTLPNLNATGTGDVSLCWTTGGTFTQGSVCGTSLEETKTNLSPLQHGLDYVMQLQPITFDQAGASHIGFGARATASVDPLLGAYRQDGELYNITDRAILATLTKAVQELQRKKVDKK